MMRPVAHVHTAHGVVRTPDRLCRCGIAPGMVEACVRASLELRQGSDPGGEGTNANLFHLATRMATKHCVCECNSGFCASKSDVENLAAPSGESMLALLRPTFGQGASAAALPAVKLWHGLQPSGK